MAMTEQELFAAGLELELAMRGAAHDRPAIALFVAASWPLIEKDQDVKRWAQRFIDSRAATAKG